MKGRRGRQRKGGAQVRHERGGDIHVCVFVRRKNRRSDAVLVLCA